MMTCNQLITLLEIYRIGRTEHIECGTTPDDIRYLIQRKLIQRARVYNSRIMADPKGDRYMTTDRGSAMVAAILTLL